MRWLIRATRLVAVLIGLGTIAGSPATPSSPIPDAFVDLNGELDRNLAAANQSVDAGCSVMRPRALFSAELPAANSNRGSSPDADFLHLRIMVDRFVRLRMQAVTITVSYPFLLPAYHSTPTEYQEALDRYRRLAGEIRRRGLKLIVKTQAMLPSMDPRLDPFYESLTFDEYKRGRIEVAKTIARELKPDFLSVQYEPDIEALATGQPVNTLSDGIELVRSMAGAVNSIPGSERVAVGAGVGTWQRNYREYVEALASLPTLAFIDMHLYPIGRDYAVRALEIADIAAARGKRVGVSEAWLYKIRDRELILAGPLATDVLGRDAYDFWSGLDRRFLALMIKLSYCKGLAFMSPSRSDYFFAYLDYDQTRQLSSEERLRLVASTAAVNAMAGDPTVTGAAYARLTSIVTREPRSADAR